jgi:hypothetical protein
MRLAPALATLVAGAALALVIAHWGWQIFGPAPRHIAPSGPADPVATIIAADLFSRADVAKAATPARAVLPGDARLLGIIAGAQQRGYALFRLADGAKIVAQGQEIAPGVTLVAVEPFVVTIRDGAGERRVALPENGSTRVPVTPTAPSRTTSAAAASQPAARKTSLATCAPPAGFHGKVVRLNAELLGGLAGDAGPWRTLLVPANGALVVREEGGFGAMLGLRPGDRIAQANGIALRVPDDVASAVIRPLIANQGVRVVGSRGGTTQELWLANVACAG